MPRAVKTKAATAAVGASPAKKPKSAPKKKKLYDMPEHLNPGTLVTDLTKVTWQVGETIGMGGFGEIYLACKKGEKDYNYVLKCEPFENGPLFVEMHFYLRNVRPAIIEAFKQKRGLKSLGMPHLVGNGSTEINEKKHRFIVMPRYGANVQTLIDQNNGKIPEATIYRLTLQMLDVLQFIHSVGYVHADLKATNIVLGHGKGGGAQAYLVDYGLAARINSGEYKPDPRKMHNGTIEYTSRDAHLGVTTIRGDLEILAYNLIDWFGGTLPWVKDNLLAAPPKVQAAKETFMKDASKNLQKIFAGGVPASLNSFVAYVATLKHDETPDYDKCRKIFADALKALKVANTGDLEFTVKADKKKTKEKEKQKPSKIATVSSEEEEVISESEPDESTRKPLGRVGKTHMKSPKGRVLKTEPITKKSPVKSSNSSSSTPKLSPRQNSKRTPLAAKTNINIKPAFSISSNTSNTRSPKRTGNTIINDTLTPPASNRGNTYEFNFELDVSMDANVVVNVKRKKKDVKKSTATTISQSSEEQETEDSSPRTRAKLRKIVSEKSDSIIVPATKVIRTKRK